MAVGLVRGKALSILFSTLLLGRAISVRGHSEVRVELEMDRWAPRGGSVRLRCLHDVPPRLLDKVVFLRNGTKIFQYIRDRKPPYRNFTTPGAVLNVALSSETSVVLQSLDFAASGSYSCEVSIDTPIYTKSSLEKQLTVFHPQKHNPRIDFPTRFLSSGETLRANCTSAPALPAPHITWFINGRKMEEVAAKSHKVRVPMSERAHGRRSLNRSLDRDWLESSSESPLIGLFHATHAAPRQHNCIFKDNQLHPEQLREESNAIISTRHKSHPASRGLYVSVSQLQLVATGRLDIVCVSTIPEFRSIRHHFADIRNDTVIVDVIEPSTYMHAANLTKMEPTVIVESSSSSRNTVQHILYLSLLAFSSQIA